MPPPLVRTVRSLYNRGSRSIMLNDPPLIAPPCINLTDVAAPHTGRVRILTLNRPAARNAISQQLLHELRIHINSIFNEYEKDSSERWPVRPLSWSSGVGAGPVAGILSRGLTRGPTRALIIASEVDSCFCAGADLKERAGFSTEETMTFLASLRATLRKLTQLPIPSISAIAAPALGGGLELALATTFRVLASTATVALPETRLGIIPGAGGTYRLSGIIGAQRARDIIMTGRRVSGQEAHFLGLADRLVDIPERDQKDQGGGDGDKEETKKRMRRAREEVLEKAVGLANEVCEGAPFAIRMALRAVSLGTEGGENLCYNRVLRTEDRDEALLAFKEKRKPQFRGK